GRAGRVELVVEQVAGGVLTHLDGGGRHAGNDLAAGLVDVGHVADEEDLGVARQGEVGLHDDASAAVAGQRLQAGDRRGANARGPHDRGGLDDLVAEVDLV